MKGCKVERRGVMMQGKYSMMSKEDYYNEHERETPKKKHAHFVTISATTSFSNGLVKEVYVYKKKIESTTKYLCIVR